MNNTEKQEKLKKVTDSLLEYHKLLIEDIENEKPIALGIMGIIKIATILNSQTENRLEITVKLKDM